MSLKDLLVSKATLTEEAIEKIVVSYVHYDPEEKAITLNHSGATLPAKKKVLVYLVALQGWPYVTEEAIPTDASPAELVEHLGTPGGTIRPLLMNLSERHLLISKKGRYSVRAASLHAITKELDEDEGIVPRSNAKPSSRSRRPKGADKNETSSGRRGKSSKKRGQTAMFDGWIEQGFFDEPRTHAAVVKKFRQAGIIVPDTSMPILFLRAIRTGRLVREEAEVSGRNVWVYKRPK